MLSWLLNPSFEQLLRWVEEKNESKLINYLALLNKPLTGNVTVNGYTYYVGTTIVWRLAQTPWGTQFLAQHLELLEGINLDAAPTDGDDLGISVLWWLARYSDGRQILLQLLSQEPGLLEGRNLDAAPTQGVWAGVNVLWLLASELEDRQFLLPFLLQFLRQLLLQHPDLLQSRSFDAAPTQGEWEGISVLWWLAWSEEGRQFLLDHPKLLEDRKLDVAPVRGTDAGKTLLWLLACEQGGRQLLLQHPELLDGRNLNAAPMQGEWTGASVLWWFVSEPEGRRILLQNPELLKRGNLAAAPIRGEWADESVLWWLAREPEGRRILIQFLLQHPDLLQGRNLDATPTQGECAGQSVLWWLAKEPKGRQILLELLLQCPELLVGRNFNTAPMRGYDAGKSVLWWLARFQEGRQLLLQHPELLQDRNLDARPTKGENVGKTVLWLLASNPEGGQLLLQHPELLEGRNLDAAPAKGPDAGKTVLWLLAWTAEGRQLLLQHPELLKRGNLDAAATQGECVGITVLRLLASTEEGRQLLLQHPELLQGRNLDAAPAKGPNAGITVLWLFACTREGRQLLLQHPELLHGRNLDTAPIEGEDAGKTVLWLLAATSEGRQLLLQHSELLEGKNRDAAPAKGPNAGKTVLWLLAGNAEGRQLLQLHPKLLEGGNLDAAAVAQDEWGGTTPLWGLARFQEGRQLLLQHPELLQDRNLDAAPVEGEDAGKTVLWLLACTREGRQLLLQHPELLEGRNLDAAPTEGEGAGKTVLWLLAATSECRQLLLQHPELLEGRNLDVAPAKGSNAGITVLWCLAWSKEGLQLLRQHPELFQKGNLGASATQGEYAGKTVLWLLAWSIGGLKLLTQHPELLQKGNLDVSATQGEYAGKTILWLLAWSKEGLQLLLQHPELLEEKNLDAASTQGEWAGTTVLWWLIQTPEGIELLHKHLQINREFLKDKNLDAAATQGEDAGKSVLWWLACSEKGRELLLTYPELLEGRNLNAGPTPDKSVLCLLEQYPETKALAEKIKNAQLQQIQTSLQNVLETKQQIEEQKIQEKEQKQTLEDKLKKFIKEKLRELDIQYDFEKPLMDLLGSNADKWDKLIRGIETQFMISLDGVQENGIINLIKCSKERIEASQCLVRWRSNRSDSDIKPAGLFFFHPIMGDISRYRTLCENLNTHILKKRNLAIYLYSSPVLNLDVDSERFKEDYSDLCKLEYQAKMAIQAMKAVQHEGPYYLCGWSYGGVLTIEIARQLKIAGEKVKFIGLVDPQVPEQLRALDKPMLIHRLLKHINFISRYKLANEKDLITTEELQVGKQVSFENQVDMLITTLEAFQRVDADGYGKFIKFIIMDDSASESALTRSTMQQVLMQFIQKNNVNDAIDNIERILEMFIDNNKDLRFALLKFYKDQKLIQTVFDIAFENLAIETNHPRFKKLRSILYTLKANYFAAYGYFPEVFREHHKLDTPVVYIAEEKADDLLQPEYSVNDVMNYLSKRTRALELTTEYVDHFDIITKAQFANMLMRNINDIETIKLEERMMFCLGTYYQSTPFSTLRFYDDIHLSLSECEFNVRSMKSPSLHIETLFKSEPNAKHIIITGKGGSGKSSLARKLTLENFHGRIWKEKRWEKRWVFNLSMRNVLKYVNAKEHPVIDNNACIETLLYHELFKVGDMNMSFEEVQAAWIDIKKSPEQVCFILDDVDDVLEQSELEFIFMSLFKSNMTVIVCTGEVDGHFKRLKYLGFAAAAEHKFKVDEIEDERYIKKFIKNYFNQREKNAEKAEALADSLCKAIETSPSSESTPYNSDISTERETTSPAFKEPHFLERPTDNLPILTLPIISSDVNKPGLENEARFYQLLRENIDRSCGSSLFSLFGNYTLGRASGEGDCFFDALAQQLNRIRNTDVNTAKYLRMLCHDFYMANKPLVDAWNKADETFAEQGDAYDKIQYTYEDCEKDYNGRSPIWGRPFIEGKMLCAQLQLPGFCVIEIMEDPGTKQFILAYQWITKEGSRSVGEEELAQRLTPETPILVVEQDGMHFVPLFLSMLDNRATNFQKQKTTYTNPQAAPTLGPTKEHARQEPECASYRRNVSLRDLSRNPLCLIQLCAVWHHQAQLGHSDLSTRKIVKFLARKLLHHNGIEHNHLLVPADIREQQQLIFKFLSLCAYRTILSNSDAISAKKMQSWLSEFKQEINFLNKILATSVLVPVGLDTLKQSCKFNNILMQLYFASEYFLYCVIQNKITDEVLMFVEKAMIKIDAGLCCEFLLLPLKKLKAELSEGLHSLLNKLGNRWENCYELNKLEFLSHLTEIVLLISQYDSEPKDQPKIIERIAPVLYCFSSEFATAYPVQGKKDQADVESEKLLIYKKTIEKLESECHQLFAKFKKIPGVEVKYSGNETVLHYAVKKQDSALTELLLKLGADPESRNDAGARPIDVAQEKEFTTGAELINQAREKRTVKDLIGQSIFSIDKEKLSKREKFEIFKMQHVHQGPTQNNQPKEKRAYINKRKDEIINDFLNQWVNRVPSSQLLDEEILRILESYSKVKKKAETTGSKEKKEFFEICQFIKENLLKAYVKDRQNAANFLMRMLELGQYESLKPILLSYIENKREILHEVEEYKVFYNEIIIILRDENRNLLGNSERNIRAALDKIIQCPFKTEAFKQFAIEAIEKCVQPQLMIECFDSNIALFINVLLEDYRNNNLMEKSELKFVLEKFLLLVCQKCYQQQIEEEVAHQIAHDLQSGVVKPAMFSV